MRSTKSSRFFVVKRVCIVLALVGSTWCSELFIIVVITVDRPLHHFLFGDFYSTVWIVTGNEYRCSNNKPKVVLCIHGKIKNAFRFNFFRRTHENVLGQRYNEWISSDQFRKRTKIKINWTFYVFFVVNIFCLANFVFFFYQTCHTDMIFKLNHKILFFHSNDIVSTSHHHQMICIVEPNGKEKKGMKTCFYFS